MEEYLISNWAYILAIFYVLEKLVKLSPTKADDILIDVLYGGIKKLVGKE